MARFLIGLSLLALLALAALLVGPPPAEPGLGLAAVRNLHDAHGAHDADDAHNAHGDGVVDGHGDAHDAHDADDAHDAHEDEDHAHDALASDHGHGDGDHGDVCAASGHGHGDGDHVLGGDTIFEGHHGDVTTAADSARRLSGHGDDHEQVDPVSCAVMFVFFGSLVMGGAVTTLMRWNDPDIRMAANQMVSVSVSIFCAMTLFKMIEDLIFKQIIAGKEGRGLGITHLSYEVELVINAVIFPGLLASITWCCRRTYTNNQDLVTWFNVAKLLVPHIAGFSGFVLSAGFLNVVISKFSHYQSHSFLYVLSIFGLVLLIRLLCWGLHRLRQRAWYTENKVDAVAEADSGDSPRTQAQNSQRQHENSLHECTEAIEEGEDDVTAFVLSGALYSFFHYLMLSREGSGCSEYAACFHLVPSALPKTCEHEAIARAWIHYFCPALLAQIFTTCPCWQSNNALLKRVLRFLSMASGLLTSRLVHGMVVHCFFWMSDSKVTVYMGAAIFTTIMTMGLTFVFDQLADLLEGKAVNVPDLSGNDRGTAGDSISDAEAQEPLSSTGTAKESASRRKSYRRGAATRDDIGHRIAASTRGLISVFGLLVGLSWEAVFEVGEHDLVLFVNERMKERRLWNYEHPVVIEVTLSVAVLVCVVPVWAKHMIPLAEKDRAYHKRCIDEESKSETKDMFTFAILRSLWLSCCPVFKRVSFCKGRSAKAR